MGKKKLMIATVVGHWIRQKKCILIVMFVGLWRTTYDTIQERTRSIHEILSSLLDHLLYPTTQRST